MIAIIRITGQVGLRTGVKETLHRLRIRRKYACVIVQPSKEKEGMIKAVKDFVAFGEISKDVLQMLIEKRAQPIDKKTKVDAKKLTEDIMKGKKMETLGIKPFFRLHPPRGGIKSKIHYKKGGVLGDHKEKINDLIKRML